MVRWVQMELAIRKWNITMRFPKESPSYHLSILRPPLAEHDPTEDLRIKFSAFRDEVLSSNRLASLWEGTELKAHVVTSLHKAIRDTPGIGWIRANLLPPSSDEAARQLAREVERLNSELWNARRMEHEVERLKTMNGGIATLFRRSTRPATELEINEWSAKLGEQYPSLPTTLSINNTLVATKDCILPALYGASSIELAVPPGIHVEVPDLGHSRVVYLDGFRRLGI